MRDVNLGSSSSEPVQKSIKHDDPIEPKPFHKYVVWHFTNIASGSGTNAMVFVHLMDGEGRAIIRQLDSDRNDRMTGALERYEIEAAPLDIRYIGFRLARNPRIDADTPAPEPGAFQWRCDWAQVDDLTAGYSYYVTSIGTLKVFDIVRVKPVEGPDDADSIFTPFDE